MSVQSLKAILWLLCVSSPLLASPAVSPLYLTSYPRSSNLPGSRIYYDDEYYHLTVGVGTPAVDFNLTLSSSFFGVDTVLGVGNVLFGKGYCKCGPCAEPALQPKRKEYDVSASSTAKITSGKLADDYTSLGDPYDNPLCEANSPLGHTHINGTRVTDVVAVSKTQIGSVPLNVIKQIDSLNRKWKADGIFQYDQGHKLVNATVLHLLSGAKASPDATLGGHVIFGAKDVPSMCDGNWTNVAYGFKPFIQNVMIGSKSMPKDGDGPSPAQIRLNSAYTRVSSEILESIAHAVGAEYDFESDTYVVRCAAVATMPDMVFHLTDLTIRNSTYSVPARVYTRQMKRDVSKCRLMFDSCLQGEDLCDTGYEWVLGSSFLRPYCHRLVYKDASTTIYSIAKAKF